MSPYFKYSYPGNIASGVQKYIFGVSVFHGPVPPGWDEGTTSTLAGAGPLFMSPSSATVKAGPGEWQLLS